MRVSSAGRINPFLADSSIKKVNKNAAALNKIAAAPSFKSVFLSDDVMLRNSESYSKFLPKDNLLINFLT